MKRNFLKAFTFVSAYYLLQQFLGLFKWLSIKYDRTSQGKRLDDLEVQIVSDYQKKTIISAIIFGVILYILKRFRINL